MSVTTYATTRVGSEEYCDLFADIILLDSRKFYSEGRNGKFELRTFITKERNGTEQQLLNLGFGVWDEERLTIDDRVRTKNEDMQQILATVAFIALDFLSQNPSAYLYAEGSTFARTRLYQREVSKVFNVFPEKLQLHGLIRDDDIGFVEFGKGINFDGFLLSVRNR